MATRSQTPPRTDQASRLGAVRKVGKALLAQEDKLGKSMASRIVEEIPRYRRASPELLQDVLAGATATGHLLASAFAQGVELRREDVEVVREVARRRVQQDVSPEDFQHAYRAALFAFWDACAREATRLKVPREASLHLARFAMQAMDLVTTQAAEAYAREEARVQMRSGRAERDLIERLIGGYAPKERRRHPAAPGLDPASQLIVVVGRVEDAATPVADALQVAREILEENMSVGRARPLIAIRQSEIVLIAPGTAPASRGTASIRAARQRALGDHQTDIRYGVSGPASGFPGIASAYREATLSLSYSSPARPVIALGDLSSLECALIGSDATAKAMILSKARGLTALPSDELAMVKATVRAFAASDLNVNRAAATLFVHANTVRYRLGRIAETTGYDPRTFAGLLELVCVIDTLENHQIDHNGPRAAAVQMGPGQSGRKTTLPGRL
jgi:hypothetical protein